VPDDARHHGSAENDVQAASLCPPGRKAAAARAPFAAPKVSRTMAVTESPRQSDAASRNRRTIMLAVGLAAVTRLPRDRRFQRNVIVLVVGLAAAARLAQNGQTNSLARLAAWDRRQQVRLLRTVKGKEKLAVPKG
jgi:hypothetical protein